LIIRIAYLILLIHKYFKVRVCDVTDSDDHYTAESSMGADQFYETVHFDTFSTHSDKQTVLDEATRTMRKFAWRVYAHWRTFQHHPLIQPYLK